MLHISKREVSRAGFTFRQVGNVQEVYLDGELVERLPVKTFGPDGWLAAAVRIMDGTR